MPEIWRVYRVKDCRHTTPHKDKFVVIVCRDAEFMGFLINSTINRFIAKRPHLAECQIMLSKSDYGFLFHDSHLNCARICSFRDNELMVGLELINEKTKAEIKKAVSNAKTIEKRYQELILNSP